MGFDHLVARRFPALELECVGGQGMLNIGEYTTMFKVVVYLGPRESAEEIEGTRAWRWSEHAADLASLGYRVVGVSAQPMKDLRELASRASVPYHLLSDGDLLLAQTLGLPTRIIDGASVYEDLVLIAATGRVWRVFSSLGGPRIAGRVLEWLACEAQERRIADRSARLDYRPPGQRGAAQ